VRVAIAEDSGIFRQALVALLETVDVVVTATFGTGEELVAFLERDPAGTDVAVLDLRMPPTFTDEGVRAACRIKTRHPDLGVLVLSAFDDPPRLAPILCGSCGGVGYLLKDNVPDVTALRDCLCRIRTGQVVVDPTVALGLDPRQGPDERLHGLSAREREVLSLMSRGYSNTGIAGELAVSRRTAEDHVRTIFLKLGLGDSGACGCGTEGNREGNKRVLAVLAWLRATRFVDVRDGRRLGRGRSYGCPPSGGGGGTRRGPGPVR